MYEAKKTIKVLGLDYEKIHARLNDCILYRNKFKNLSDSPSCGVSRWQIRKMDPKTLERCYESVDVFDVYRKQTFNLRLVLMWTISDFPAYGEPIWVYC